MESLLSGQNREFRYLHYIPFPVKNARAFLRFPEHTPEKRGNPLKSSKEGDFPPEISPCFGFVPFSS
jgi:hypothetical protein